MKKLQDKVALVTGGAKRIGKGIAFALAGEGANVAITYRDSADEAHETVRELEDYGIRSAAIHANLLRLGTFPGNVSHIRQRAQEEGLARG